MSETEKRLPYIPEEWSEAASSVAYDSITWPPPVALVCGPKNCRKTTFSRVLIEFLLQRYKKVAYLDTDFGQPEFTAPGFLSFTVVDKSILDSDLTVPCVKTPERCFFFGDVSSRRDPKAYLRCIFTLYDYYQLQFCKSSKKEIDVKELPLFINIPGWVKGIGYHMLVDILRYIPPTHVVKINISAESKNLPPGLFWLDSNNDKTVNLIEIHSACRDSFNRSVTIQKDARLMRDIWIITYFRQCIRDKDVTTIKELAHELASHTPYEVPMSSIKIKHLHCQESFGNRHMERCPVWDHSHVRTNSSEGRSSLARIHPTTYLLVGAMYTCTAPYSIPNINSSVFRVKDCRSPYMSSNMMPTS